MKNFYAKHRSLKSDWEEWTIVLCCIAMLAGMFFSRVLLSGAMLLLFLNALRPGVFRRNLDAWRRDTFSWFALSFWTVYVVSGLWSQNTAFWWASVVNKIPFVILPFSLLAVPALRKAGFQKMIILSLIIMQLAIIVYSIGQLMLHKEYYLQGYHVSQPLATTRYGDHIRFSLSLVLSILMSFYLLFDQKRETVSTGLKVFLYFVIVLFSLYIHVLAAKTGLVCFYLMAVCYTFVRLFRYNKSWAFILTAFILALPFAAYYVVPTFRTKMEYVFYEIGKTRQNQRYDYTLSDAGRMITYQIGLTSIAAHPIMGVGAGDLMDEMRLGYNESYPEVSVDQQFGPINQVLYTALCVGIPLSFSLLGMIWTSFRGRGRLHLYLGITALLMFFSVMVESMLELQFGVFTYLFFILFWKSVISGEQRPG